MVSPHFPMLSWSFRLRLNHFSPAHTVGPSLHTEETNGAGKLTSAQASSLSAMVSLVRGFKGCIKDWENLGRDLFSLVRQHLGDKAFQKEFSLEDLCDVAN